jgi:hypothetical protein
VWEEETMRDNGAEEPHGDSRVTRSASGYTFQGRNLSILGKAQKTEMASIVSRQFRVNAQRYDLHLSPLMKVHMRAFLARYSWDQQKVELFQLNRILDTFNEVTAVALPTEAASCCTVSVKCFKYGYISS